MSKSIEGPSRYPSGTPRGIPNGFKLGMVQGTVLGDRKNMSRRPYTHVEGRRNLWDEHRNSRVYRLRDPELKNRCGS